MDRKKRIRIVVAAATGLFAMFIATVGAPLLAVAYLPSPEEINQNGAFSGWIRVSQVSNMVSLISLGVAGGCLVYLLVSLAAWFIGPPEASHRVDIQ